VIPYIRLRHILRATTRAHLPPFKGSLLRGAFGHALRKAVCMMGPAQECVDCRLRQACVYTRIFETFIEGDPPPFLKGIDTAPRPYIFEPRTEAQGFAPGDPLEFDLLLLGQAVDLQAYALLTVERMAAAGLGRDRFPFELAEVHALEPSGAWRTVFADGRVISPGALAPCLPSDEIPAGRAVLHFLTPTRLQIRHRPAGDVAFRPLAFAMLRRALELAWFHVPGAPVDWNLRPLLDQADTVHVTASHLTWKDWDRYSNRQKQKMTLGGFVGTLEIEGDLTPFAPLLRTAEIVHVGKNTTFGLGQVRVD
jgi:hypothetical protein